MEFAVGDKVLIKSNMSYGATGISDECRSNIFTIVSKIDEKGGFRLGGGGNGRTFSVYKTWIELYKKPANTAKDARAFGELTDPLIKWLCDNQDPHTKILITPDSALLLGDRIGHQNSEFIRD